MIIQMLTASAQDQVLRTGSRVDVLAGMAPSVGGSFCSSPGVHFGHSPRD